VVSKLTEAEKAQIAQLWAVGLPERMIDRKVGRRVDRPHSTVRGYVAEAAAFVASDRAAATTGTIVNPAGSIVS
jgi:hypothetical protein